MFAASKALSQGLWLLLVASHVQHAPAVGSSHLRQTQLDQAVVQLHSSSDLALADAGAAMAEASVAILQVKHKLVPGLDGVSPGPC